MTEEKKNQIFSRIEVETRGFRNGCKKGKYLVGNITADDIEQEMLTAAWGAICEATDDMSYELIMSHAVNAMKWCLPEYVSSYAHDMRISRDDYILRKKVSEKYANAPHSSLEEIAKELECTPKKVLQALKPVDAASMDKPLGDDEDSCCLADIIADDSHEEGFRYEKELSRLSKGISETMTPRNAEIFSKVNGVNGYKKHTTTELEDEYGISHQRISKIDKNGQAALKKYFAEEDDSSSDVSARC